MSSRPGCTGRHARGAGGVPVLDGVGNGLATEKPNVVVVAYLVRSDEPRVVEPDLLADAVGRMLILVRESLPVWPAHEVAARLAVLALPVFTWQEAIDPATAAAIRLAALCLAAQAGDQPELLDLCQGIAAGVTLLERRTDGRAPLTETIVLAVT